MAVNPCRVCGSTQFETHHLSGQVACANCSTVPDDSRIVSEVSFSETNGGKAVVSGQYISHDQTGVLGNSLYGIQSGESRQQTIEKARRRLEQIGYGLQIPEHVVEASVRHFRTALTNNFVKGRKSQHVLSACLYLACRQNRTDHMLMDFAEAINVNVFYIGATYLQLVRNQKIRELPIVDPTVYIQRFAAKLQFGNERGRQVVNDARKLVYRMKKDWLQQGRRPAGIAAACILLAARMNNFRRSKSEIVQVAKIAEETLQRRLDEFGQTSAATLTVADFRLTDLEGKENPPSYEPHRNVSEEERQRISQRLQSQMEQRQSESAEAYNDESGRLAFPEDPFLSEDMYEMAKQVDMASQAELKFSRDVDDILNDEEFSAAARAIAKEERPESQSRSDDDAEDSDLESEDDQFPYPEDDTHNDESTNANISRISGQIDTPVSNQPTVSSHADSIANETTGEATNRTNDDVKGPAQRLLDQFRKRREERQSAERERALQDARNSAANRSLENESLSDVDDEEIESVLLNENEIEIKSKVWMSINKDYLLEQERKRLRKEADAANGIVKPQRKRRKTRVKRDPGESASAGANAANMLKEKVHSKKINYAAVKELFSK